MNFRQNLKIPVIVHVAPMRRFKKEFTTVKPVWKKKIGNTSYIGTKHSTVEDRVMKSYLNYIPYNQYYPRVYTKKCY